MCGMWLLDFLQNLSLMVMFLATLVIGFILCWIVLVLTRLVSRKAGFDSKTPLPMAPIMIGAVSTIFALMMAFSAAGIWNDALHANSAVQREANALENVLALAASLPADLRGEVTKNVDLYGRRVVGIDWPAMARKVAVSDPIYSAADDILTDLINLLSREHGRIVSLPTIAPLLDQIAQARSARLTRITLANGGVSVAQWLAMLLIALAALTVVAICHNHHFGIQATAMHLYTLAAAAAFFVILAHDRPFVGIISVSPAPFVDLATPR
jgi:hypothetical protein